MTTTRLGNTSFPTGIGRGCVRQNNAGFWSVASKVTAGSYSRPVRTTTVCVVGVNRWGRNEVRTMSAHGLNRGHGPMVKRFSESQIHEEVMGASAPTASEVEV